jgi:uncharacterized protein YndB with AHSA1/START domain
MNDLTTLNPYGVLSAPATLTIQRLLPGPVELVWPALTKDELRRQWLASGEMEMKLGSSFEFVWRNDELSNPPAERPEGFEEEYRMHSRITELDAPRKLSIAWDQTGEVTFELEPQGKKVLLTVIHRGLSNRATLLAISAGWHMHLDILVARSRGQEVGSFWAGWSRLRQDYERRFAA